MRSLLLKCFAYAIAIPAVLTVILFAVVGLFAGVLVEGVKLGWTIGRFLTGQAIMASNILQTVAMSAVTSQQHQLRVVTPDPVEEESDDLPA